MKFANVLVPVDYSLPARRSLELALSLVLPLGGRLDIVHVWDRPAYVPEGALVAHEGSHRSIVEIIRENAELEMSEFLSPFGLGSEARVTSRLLAGEPATAILEELSRGKHDLVIIGTRGRSGMTRLLLGSVTERLVRLSPVPVLTVPPLVSTHP